MILSMIACCSRNRVIGQNGRIPWHLSADLSFFKRKTMGATVMMGRLTWASFSGRVLPGRDMIVVSNQISCCPSGVRVASSPEEALMISSADRPIFIIGGCRLYRWGMLYATDLFLTEIDADYEGDTYFPVLSPRWREESREERRDPDFEHAFSFVHYRNESPVPLFCSM